MITFFRQQLRESSEELKTLEARLRAAYVSKELAAQIAERRAAEAMEKVSHQDIKLKLLNEITYQMCS